MFIVDDSAIVCERLGTLFSEMAGDIELIGHTQDPRGAIETIRALKPDAVILDIRMPGGSGIEVLQEIKKETAAPIVMMLTNFPYLQYRKRCTEAGADFFFDKSTDFDRVPQVFQELSQDPRFRRTEIGANEGEEELSPPEPELESALFLEAEAAEG